MSEGQILGDSEEDTLLLRQMGVEAKQYLLSHDWCPPVQSMELMYGVGGVIALFLIELSRPIDGDVRSLWVVIGDLPSAYLVMDPSEKLTNVVRTYCNLMSDWVKAVNNGEDVSDLFPVKVFPTKEAAERLHGKIQFIINEILPLMNK